MASLPLSPQIMGKDRWGDRLLFWRNFWGGALRRNLIIIVYLFLFEILFGIITGCVIFLCRLIYLFPWSVIMWSVVQTQCVSTTVLSSIYIARSFWKGCVNCYQLFRQKLEQILLKSYLFENMSEDMISMYFPPKFEFLNSDFAWTRLLKWLILNSKRFSNP